MASEDVEIVRRMIQRFGEERRLAPLREYFSDETEISGLRAALEGTVWRGPGALDAFDEAVAESWTELSVRARRYEDCGDGRLLVHGVLVLVGKDTGIELEQECTWAVSVRERRITRLATYLDEQQARASFEKP